MTFLEPADHDSAPQIGGLYRHALSSVRDSLENLIICGRKLNEVKASLPYGEWELWLKSNQGELGFNSGTARRLMRAAKERSPATVLTEDEAIAISRQIWGHESHVEPDANEPAPISAWRGFDRFLKWTESHAPTELAAADPAEVRTQIVLLRQWLASLENALTLKLAA